MFTELTNLLPASRIRAFRRAYFFRVATVFCSMLIALITAHGLFLLPSYLYAQSEVVAETTQLNTVAARLQTSEEQQVQARLGLLTKNVQYLNQLATTTTASAALQAVLAVPRTGIALSGFTFTPPGKNAGAMNISGTAATRDTLRTYALALQQLPFVTSADLPISAYAQDSNIPFTITLTGTLRP